MYPTHSQSNTRTFDNDPPAGGRVHEVRAGINPTKLNSPPTNAPLHALTTLLSLARSTTRLSSGTTARSTRPAAENASGPPLQMQELTGSVPAAARRTTAVAVAAAAAIATAAHRRLVMSACTVVKEETTVEMRACPLRLAGRSAARRRHLAS
jgi:hypothetical protein